MFAYLWLAWFNVLLLVACEAPPTAVICTNICVAPELEAFYIQNGGERIFGAPHIRPYLDTRTGNTIQYFDSARLEQDANSGEISIYPLGEWAYAGLDKQDPLPALADAGRQERINGFVVRDAFLDFYENNGGRDIFGLPISNQLDEAELRVQYFENARLEWHPEAPSDRQVQVGMLGRAHYLYVAYSPLDEEQRFIPSDETRPTTAELTAAARFPILYEGESQIIFILAETTDGQAVEELNVELFIEYGSQTYTQPIEGKTDKLGTIQAELDLQNLTPGEEVIVTINVYDPLNDDRLIGTESITFQTWW